MLAKPTSETEPNCREFRKMFEDLMFPWTSFPPLSACIRAIPLAAPIAILSRVSQSKGTLSSPLLPEKMKIHTVEHFRNSKQLARLRMTR